MGLGNGGPHASSGPAVSLAEQLVRLRGKFLSAAEMLWSGHWWHSLRPATWYFRRSRWIPPDQRKPRRSPGAIWAAMTRHGIVSPRRNSPSRGVAPTITPNQRPRISQPSMRTSSPGELIAAELPQVLVLHDSGDGSQVGSGSREPPRDHQDLGRGKDAHHDSMGMGGAR